VSLINNPLFIVTLQAEEGHAETILDASNVKIIDMLGEEALLTRAI
jgi:hypothetical protein